MTSAFTTGFIATMQFLLTILGGVSAVMLCASVLGTVVFILASVFDFVTAVTAKRWAKKGKKPKGRIGEIILRSVQDDGSV